MGKDIWEIETLQAGQPRPYADHVYVYLVHNSSETEYARNVFEKLCTKFIHPVKPMDAPDRNWADGEWKLEKVDNRTYKYYVTEAYTG